NYSKGNQQVNTSKFFHRGHGIVSLSKNIEFRVWFHRGATVATQSDAPGMQEKQTSRWHEISPDCGLMRLILQSLHGDCNHDFRCLVALSGRAHTVISTLRIGVKAIPFS